MSLYNSYCCPLSIYTVAIITIFVQTRKKTYCLDFGVLSHLCDDISKSILALVTYL